MADIFFLAVFFYLSLGFASMVFMFLAFVYLLTAHYHYLSFSVSNKINQYTFSSLEEKNIRSITFNAEIINMSLSIKFV